MKLKSLKISKSIISKLCVALMLFAYLFLPVQKQMNNFLHEIIHIFEKPDIVFVHISKENKAKSHKSEIHKSIKQSHNHKILDLISEVFKKSTTEKKLLNSPKLVRKIIKYNKREVRIYIKKKPSFFASNKLVLTAEDNQLSKGFLSVIKEPPKKIAHKLFCGSI